MIAIMAPYDRSETTLAALRLADLAVSTGADVFYLVSGTRGHNIHRYWDRHAISKSNRDRLLDILPAKFKHVISFGMIPYHHWRHVPTMGLTVPGTFYDCVVSPYEMVRAETYLWNQLQRLICPSEPSYRVAAAAGYLGNAGPITITRVHWASGDDFVPTLNEGPTRFAAICDAGCLREYPENWFHTVNQFLRYTDHVIVDCYLNCSLPRRARSMVRELKEAHPGRFSTQTPLCIQDLMIWLRDRDIAVYPSCRTTFGYYAAMCAAIRMPLLAVNISPIDEIAPHGINSLLVDMNKRTEPCGVERAQFDAQRWITGWLDLVGNPQLLADRTQTAEELRAKSERGFKDFWLASWEAILG